MKHILYRFAEHEQFKFTVDRDELTIEHIASQAGIGTGKLTDDLVGQLGNLFLLDLKMNGKLEGKPFTEKLQVLKAGGYSLPDAVALQETWTLEKAKDHTVVVAEIAYKKTWSL